MVAQTQKQKKIQNIKMYTALYGHSNEDDDLGIASGWGIRPPRTPLKPISSRKIQPSTAQTTIHHYHHRHDLHLHHTGHYDYYNLDDSAVSDFE